MRWLLKSFANVATFYRGHTFVYLTLEVTFQNVLSSMVSAQFNFGEDESFFAIRRALGWRAFTAQCVTDSSLHAMNALDLWVRQIKTQCLAHVHIVDARAKRIYFPSSREEVEHVRFAHRLNECARSTGHRSRAFISTWRGSKTYFVSPQI